MHTDGTAALLHEHRQPANGAMLFLALAADRSAPLPLIAEWSAMGLEVLEPSSRAVLPAQTAIAPALDYAQG